MNTFAINGKPAVINGLRQLRNLSSWLVGFLVVPFNKIPPFSKDLIVFITYLIYLFVRVIPEPVVDEIFFLIFLSIILSPVSTRRPSSNFLVPVSFDNSLCGKLVSSLQFPIKFDGRFKVTLVKTKKPQYFNCSIWQL